VHFGDFQFDLEARLLTHGSRRQELSPKALEVLAVLVKNAGHVVRKDDLLTIVWPHTFVEEGILAVHVSMLRKVLAQDGDGGNYIETIPKQGYRFAAPVHSVLKAGAIAPNNASASFSVAEHYLQQNTAAACRRASAIYRKCIENNPLNGRARARLADSLLLRFILGDLELEKWVGNATTVLEEAKEIDPGCPEVHLSLARLHCIWDWQWQKASEEIQNARELAIDEGTRLNADAWDGLYLSRLGDLDRGLRQLRKVSIALPLNPQVWYFLAEAYYLARDFTHAAAACTEALDLHPHCWYLHMMAGKAITMLGDYPEALRQLRLAKLLCPEVGPDLIGAIAYVYALTGKRDRAATLLKRILTRPAARNPSLISLAMVQVALGDKSRAIDNIGGAYAGHDWYIAGLKRDCFLDPLRVDSRFRRVLSQTGMLSWHD
jgi:DNA-binding winged helix-turn-helix (wHTH) protein/Tfp pilus assembly protein PilF